MKVREWLEVTHVEDRGNMSVNDRFYDPERDGNKKIGCVIVQDHGVVLIYTKSYWKRKIGR